ncbi:hypothetical protein EYF80_000674 [Liparis tanakae]|uniref:Uncharacterized protein n=1 Tax=Liparis tanakae TaxID=230148 RepID=A0A4Z2JGI2_9TELE|nr:hypothetical protein EYF80_000674 [Liparis tanakae]
MTMTDCLHMFEAVVEAVFAVCYGTGGSNGKDGLVEAMHVQHGSENEGEACGHKKDVTEHEEPGQGCI